MQIVKATLKANPNNSVIGFKDNSSAIRCACWRHATPPAGVLQACAGAMAEAAVQAHVACAISGLSPVANIVVWNLSPFPLVQRRARARPVEE